MKITFVGTSHGVPEKNRYCTCIMLESGGAIYFIDAGAPIVDFLVNNGKSVNDLRAVFTTHVHSDHTIGVLHLVNLMNWYYKRSSADIFITEQEHIDATIRWTYTLKRLARRFRGRMSPLTVNLHDICAPNIPRSSILTEKRIWGLKD